ncbi:corrinoid protein [Paradesulfitobacterium ferrireducens]|uniref:corrinoid protein n=1 Tax=Paradesulfitobacterium ferrireducens TaxID=2816476 RepID=UPI001A8EFD33|nr:corrinoid protein [Paradesulfitobacterium ferrireducens]
MSREEILTRLTEAVIEGDDSLVVELTQKAVDAGVEPLVIINDALTKGIRIVGEYFGSGQYFLPDLLLGAKAMDAGVKLLEPLLVGTSREFHGRVLMGTVQGDLHEIGKNIVGMMLKTSGFEVVDLGVDVPAGKFIEKIKELKPNVIGISALLTTTIGRQKEIIEVLTEEGLRDQVKVMIGGAPINQAWADKIGADGYAEDAITAVEICKKLVAAS